MDNKNNHAPGRAVQAAFVGVDWGTSSFRAWLMAADGQVLAHTRSSEGMLHCAQAGFAPVLQAHLAQLQAPAGLPVLMCGMVGARQGWLEAPYLHTPTRLDALHQGAVPVPFDFAGHELRILPGVACTDARQPDVMRGEETQLLGAIAPDFTGSVCIPGTHSKWVSLQHGAISGFATCMTGELFAVLSRHSILSHAVEATEAAEVAAAAQVPDAAFLEGVAGALREPAALTQLLFRLRAAQLLGHEQRADGAARLSGLLIGAEIAAMRARQEGAGAQGVQLIAAGRLGTLYHAALEAAGFAPTLRDAEDASRQGLVQAARRLWLAPR